MLLLLLLQQPEHVATTLEGENLCNIQRAAFVSYVHSNKRCTLDFTTTGVPQDPDTGYNWGKRTEITSLLLVSVGK